jgi:hypothetical protein
MRALTLKRKKAFAAAFPVPAKAPNRKDWAETHERRLLISRLSRLGRYVDKLDFNPWE